MDLIRPFVQDDIPAVLALFRGAFLRNGNHGPAQLETYFERVFFENPWYADDLPSYVHLNGGGAIVGFVGVQPRRMVWRGRPLRAAVATKIMASPAAGPLVAARLLSRVFAGPQDLVLSDLSNDAGRRVWEGLGGKTMLLYSLQWQRPLRPARHGLTWLRGRGIPAIITQALRPLGAALDALIGRLRPMRSRTLDYTVDELPLDLLATRLPDMLAGRALRPDYDESWLQWFLAMVQLNDSHRLLRRRLVRDARGEPAGWFFYFLESGGTAEILQVVARKGAAEGVLQALINDAWSGGAAMLSGRMEPGMVCEMSNQHGYLRQAGLWALAHAKDRDILDAVVSGNAFLSRVEGEW